jgi:CheY-like chemotaxis protein
MRLRALLMCRDQQSVKVLINALAEMEIEQETCLSAPEAIERLAGNHYSAVVLDFDLSAAAQVARMARSAPAQHRPVVFAMIGALVNVETVFQAGANFVLYKPLAWNKLMRALRAGKGFMQPDRRRSMRQRLETILYLQYGIASLPALLLDLNEYGLSLQAPELLPALPEVPLRFVLPGTNQMVQGSGEIIWADENGRAGMLFRELTDESTKFLKHWLHKRAPRKRTARTAPARHGIRAASYTS